VPDVLRHVVVSAPSRHSFLVPNPYRERCWSSEKKKTHVAAVVPGKGRGMVRACEVGRRWATPCRSEAPLLCWRGRKIDDNRRLATGTLSINNFAVVLQTAQPEKAFFSWCPIPSLPYNIFGTSRYVLSLRLSPAIGPRATAAGRFRRTGFNHRQPPHLQTNTPGQVGMY